MDLDGFLSGRLMEWAGKESGMTTPYSQDLRDRVLAAYGRGMRTKEIAALFGVSRAWARRVQQRWRETGERSPRRMGCPVVYKVDRVQLAELVREHPDATLLELRDLLGLECAESTICMALKELGLSFKKRRSMPRSRIVRTSSSDEPSGVRGRNESTHAV